MLEKVKAHDASALALGHPKAVGNDTADSWAKRAAMEDGHAEWPAGTAAYDDPVFLEDAGGAIVRDVLGVLSASWWDRRHRTTARARPLLEKLYPREVAVDWPASTGIFHRPIVQGNKFVHPASTAVLKWMARVRTGCLATRMRLVGHGMEHGPAVCRCCGLGDEDDEHLLTGCAATGAADWQDALLEV